MNKALLVGRITKELELRKTQTNKSVLSFTIAVKMSSEKTEFIDIQCWGQRAEFLNQYAPKGTLISAIGRIESNVYTKKDGNKVKNTYVVADEVEILSKPKESAQGQVQAPAANNQGVTSVYRNEIDTSDFGDDDFPWK